MSEHKKINSSKDPKEILKLCEKVAYTTMNWTHWNTGIPLSEIKLGISRVIQLGSEENGGIDYEVLFKLNQLYDALDHIHIK